MVEATLIKGSGPAMIHSPHHHICVLAQQTSLQSHCLSTTVLVATMDADRIRYDKAWNL